MPLSTYDVLVQLAHAPDRRLRMSELADSVLLTPSGLTRLVDRLCRDGLVERVRCDDDARGSFAALTERGRIRFDEARRNATLPESGASSSVTSPPPSNGASRRPGTASQDRLGPANGFVTGALHKLARFCARRHWWVIGAWIALTVVLVLASRIAGSLTSDDLTLAGTGSTKSVDLLEQRLPNEANGTNPIVLEATQGKLTDSANSAAVTDAVETLRQNPYVVRVSARSIRRARPRSARTRRSGTSRSP